MSQNYVLAEYKNLTRKVVLHGDWRKQYNSLVREVKSKFSLQGEIEIKVYDKQNKRYFLIDRSEMREIPRGGVVQIRVVSNNSGSSKKKGGKKGSGKQGLPMVPPGAPPYSKQDDAKRKAWGLGSKVEIYSEGQRQWQKGEIVNIFKDREGEWLVIKYGGLRTKEIQRFSNYIRPTQKQKQGKQSSSKSKKNKERKEDKEDAVGKRGDKKDKKQKRKKDKEKKPRKASTQDKYVKQKPASKKQQYAENEVYITSNSKHVKKYIDRAYLLLKGTAQSEAKELELGPEDVAAGDVEPAAGGAGAGAPAEPEATTTDAGAADAEPAADAEAPEDEKEASGANGAEEEDAEAEEEEVVESGNLKKAPSKTYDVIHLFGSSRAMGAVVTAAEIVKRIVPGLHQLTTLENYEVKEVWVPTEQGLKEVETVRTVTRLKVTLCTTSALAAIDQKAAGYQEPSGGGDLLGFTDYQYPDKEKKGKGRGRAKGGKGKASKATKGGKA